MRRALCYLLALPLLLGACDVFEPSGPGSLTARVEGQGAQVGAAVLQVSGTGIRDFTAAGDSRLFVRQGSEPDRWRIVVVSPDGGDPVFRIDVEDVSAALPSTLVFSAAGTDDEPLAGDVHVGVTIRRE